MKITKGADIYYDNVRQTYCVALNQIHDGDHNTSALP